jgi:hypothetical protein
VKARIKGSILALKEIRPKSIDQKEIIKGFVKLFINYTKQSLINEQNEKDLTNFCLLMHQFCSQMLNDEDINEIEYNTNKNKT